MWALLPSLWGLGHPLQLGPRLANVPEMQLWAVGGGCRKREMQGLMGRVGGDAGSPVEFAPQTQELGHFVGVGGIRKFRGSYPSLVFSELSTGIPTQGTSG